MNLSRPVPLLEKWRKTKLAQWIRKNYSPSSAGTPWPYVAFGLAPGILSIIFLQGVWAAIGVGFSLIALFTVAIMLVSAHE